MLSLTYVKIWRHSPQTPIGLLGRGYSEGEPRTQTVKCLEHHNILIRPCRACTQVHTPSPMVQPSAGDSWARAHTEPQPLTRTQTHTYARTISYRFPVVNNPISPVVSELGLNVTHARMHDVRQTNNFVYHQQFPDRQHHNNDAYEYQPGTPQPYARLYGNDTVRSTSN